VAGAPPLEQLVGSWSGDWWAARAGMAGAVGRLGGGGGGCDAGKEVGGAGQGVQDMGEGGWPLATGGWGVWAAGWKLPTHLPPGGGRAPLVARPRVGGAHELAAHNALQRRRRAAGGALGGVWQVDCAAARPIARRAPPPCSMRQSCT
jgi:hypothetical protein